MSVLIVGSIAFDTIETPQETRTDSLGGSAMYCTYGASYFSPVRLVGVVGAEDWPAKFTQMLKQRDVDTSGLQVKPDEKTFHWHGRYLPDLSDRETIDIRLNAYGTFDPVVPSQFRTTPYVFLANAIPSIQLRVLDQIDSQKITLADTTDLWISDYREDLLAVMQRVDGLFLNATESMQLTGAPDIVGAGRKILEMGPKLAVIKQGEQGVYVFSSAAEYSLPAFTTHNVVDPTGAGDSFAGGVIGHLAETGNITAAGMKKAIIYGILVASFNVEDFSIDKMRQVERADIDDRLAQYTALHQV